MVSNRIDSTMQYSTALCSRVQHRPNLSEQFRCAYVPGHTALTQIPLPPNSFARARVIPMTPPKGTEREGGVSTYALNDALRLCFVLLRDTVCARRYFSL